MDSIDRQAAMLKIAKVNPMRFKSVDDFHDACVDCLKELPSAQPEEASMILGTSKDGVRLWYQCSACGEPVNADDNYCCNCGRRFING